jgi:hypothetical protein
MRTINTLVTKLNLCSHYTGTKEAVSFSLAWGHQCISWYVVNNHTWATGVPHGSRSVNVYTSHHTEPKYKNKVLKHISQWIKLLKVCKTVLFVCCNTFKTPATGIYWGTLMYTFQQVQNKCGSKDRHLSNISVTSIHCIMIHYLLT